MTVFVPRNKLRVTSDNQLQVAAGFIAQKRQLPSLTDVRPTAEVTGEVNNGGE